MSTRQKVLILMTALLLVFAACSGPTDTADYPDLPDKNSMTLPSFTGAAGTGKAAAGKAAAPGDTTYANHTLSALYVTGWALYTHAALLVPRGLFWNSFSVQPEEVTGNTWRWDVNYLAFSASLTGTADGDSTRWSMAVTGGNLDDFVWYDGVTTADGKDGYWNFYDTSSTAALIRIDYEDGAAVDHFDVKVVDPADSLYGSYIKWQAEDNDRSFTIINTAQSDSVHIQWDAVDEDGSTYVYDYDPVNQAVITDTTFCWDTKANGYRDIVCPAM